jgi:hypothetical protein
MPRRNHKLAPVETLETPETMQEPMYSQEQLDTLTIEEQKQADDKIIDTDLVHEGGGPKERPKDAKGRYTDCTERENLTELGERFKSKSAVIRHLHSQGYAPSSIAKLLGVVYQHVRNVIHQKPKKA